MVPLEVDPGEVWNDEARETGSLGCMSCEDRRVCGGLSVEASAFDCRTFCRCDNPRTCDTICVRNPRILVPRQREVRGWDLSLSPVHGAVPTPPLPSYVPLMYVRPGGPALRRAHAVAVPLAEVVNLRTGLAKFASGAELRNRLGVPHRTKLVVSGVDADAKIERLWSCEARPRLGESLRKLGASLVTTPNYSLVPDRPRWEDLFSMKRIAIVWSELAAAALPTALHINARTERDFERWTSFLGEHPEIDSVAFEFGTGGRSERRREWYANQLVALARCSDRPVKLVVRGGAPVLRRLVDAFEAVTFIDTNAYTKARSRHAITHCELAGRSLEKSPTSRDEDLTRLFEQNVDSMERFICDVMADQRTCWQTTET